MSILKLIAGVGLLLGVISLVVEIRKKGKRSLWVYVVLVAASAFLLVVAGVSNTKLQERKAAELVAVDNVQGESDVQIGQNAEPAAPAAEAADTADTQGEPEAAPDAVPEQEDAAPEAAPEPEEAAAAPAQNNAAPAAPAAPATPADALAPIADAGAPLEDQKINDPIVFSAKKSRKNPKGSDIVDYAWDFGDGVSAKGVSAKHSYPSVGTYTVTLTVTDADGRSATATRMIEVTRPENKIRFASRALPDASDVTESPETINGTFHKTYTGSRLNLDVSGFILAGSSCKCEIVAAIHGPGCSIVRNKVLQDGGEGDLVVKASCKGDPGDHTWSVERKVSGSCPCTFSNVKIDGFEY